VPHPNNGTLRLPLKTEGLHSDADAPALDTPTDPVDEDKQEDEAKPESPQDDTSPDFDEVTEPENADEPEDGADDADDADDADKAKSNCWKFLHDGLEKAKEWAKEFVESIKGNKKGEGDPPV
jgi:hypothetical protein